MILIVMKLSMLEISRLKLSTKPLERKKASHVFFVFNIEFIVSYEVTISVYHTEHIGELADELLRAGVTKLEAFDWASTEEDDS